MSRIWNILSIGQYYEQKVFVNNVSQNFMIEFKFWELEDNEKAKLCFLASS